MAENPEPIVNAGHVDGEAKPVQNGGLKTVEKSNLENGGVAEVQEKVDDIETVASSQEASEERNATAVDGEKGNETVEVKEVHEILIKEGNEIETSETLVKAETQTKAIAGISGINRIEKVDEPEMIDESLEPKVEEITVTKESTILTFKEDTPTVITKPKQMVQLVRWDLTKTIFFILFIILFIAWIVAYYAYDQGFITIPGDKKK